jgi:hypothetical protein
MNAARRTEQVLAQIAQLPRVDEHATHIHAGVDDVWSVLIETVDVVFGRAPAAVYARLVGCRDRASAGPRPLGEGSTMPGFRVVGYRPRRELTLEGRHRFSSYALIFRLEAIGPGRSRLCAETRARFPGRRGTVYRMLVIGTGGHAVAVRRVLSTIRRRAVATPPVRPSPARSRAGGTNESSMRVR